jgi:MAP kinase interacting serine/threonine kinase
MSDHNSNQAAESKRFYLGDDDSDLSEAEDEPNQRRFSMSSGCSDDFVGGTNLNFDEDSGIGMMSCDNDSNDSNDSQILPIRPLNIGKCASKFEHRQQRTRRGKNFNDFYEMHDDHLGSGAYASVKTCVSRTTGEEFAVKIVNKHEAGHTRSRILREVDVFKMCAGHPNIVQLEQWFEDENHYYMVFEKMQGGPLLSQIQSRVCFSELEAAQVTKNIANALKFLHSKHIAHRDLKPENVLCCSNSSVAPVKLCDLDLASKPSIHSIRRPSRQLQAVQSEPDLSSPVGSAEFLAPEVVETFVGEALKYNRQCDMWSLGIIIFVMLSGYTPFYGECDRDDCGWNQGQFCEDCQENLFEKIREGSFEFPPEEWDNISDEAKDLITHLLVKDARKRYTAIQVLQHPWIINAPETQLNTANNLCRNTSTKDIQQYNDHFNAMNHLVSRLSSRVEETIPSCGSTPENESALQDVYETSPQYAQNVVIEASNLLEKSCEDQNEPMINEQSEQMPAYNAQHDDMQQQLVYYPPIMNGVYYGPPMVPNSQIGYIPQQVYYSQHQPYVTNDYPPNYVNASHYGQQVFVPAPFHNPPAKLETVVEESPRSQRIENMERVSSALGLPPLAPATEKLQQHRGSLTAALSQLGLENCQNAMIRQGSSGKELFVAREAEVNV